MTSQPKGNLFVPVWVDDGVVKVLVNDAGKVVVAADITGQTVDISGQAVEVSNVVDVDIENQNVLAHLYGRSGGADYLLTSKLDILLVRLEGQEVDIEVKQQTPSDMMIGAHGYIGGGWQRQPLQWGYSAIWDEDLGEVLGGVVFAGNATGVPAGEVRILQSMSIRNTTSACTNATIYISKASGSYVVLRYVAALAANVPMLVTGTFLIGQGDTLNGYADGCTIGDNIQCGFCGYKMEIDL